MIDKSTIAQFGESLQGRVLQPLDAGYDEARAIWNGMFDRRPAMIARCRGAADVVASVRFAREHDLRVAIKSGGHGVAGTSVGEAGLTIDLAPMRSVRVDAHRRVAWVDAGATWQDVDHETQSVGLATTGGVDSRTGVGGLTLGGGLGYLARTHGLTIDNLISAEVVTAGGERLHTSESAHADLFWALRGGGGNFGIVTSFEFRLHPVGPEVMTAQTFHPVRDAREVLHFYRELMRDAPDELACYAMCVRVPPVAPFPEAFHGQTAIVLVACYSGALKAGRAALTPLHRFGNPIVNMLQPMPYMILQRSFDDGTPKGGRYYWKAHYLEGLSDDVVETLVDQVDAFPGPLSIVGIEPMRGAIARVDAAATAFAHRSAGFSFGLWAGWTDPAADEQMIARTRTFYEAMAPHATGGVYANYLDADDQEKVRSAYGGNYERLRKVKAVYDPQNFFRANQNIEPAD